MARSGGQGVYYDLRRTSPVYYYSFGRYHRASDRLEQAMNYLLIEPLRGHRLGLEVWTLRLIDAEGRVSERTFLSEASARTEWYRLVQNQTAWSEAFIEPEKRADGRLVKNS